MDELRKIPPVTRTMLGLALGMTLPCTLSIMSPYRIALYWPLVSRHPISEFYRLFTAFFYAGRGISMILDIYFLFRNGNDLESNKFFRKTSNYVWALLLTATMILVLNYPLGSFFLWKPLLMSLTYLWARANPHARVSFFGFFTIVASYLPYVQLVLDLVVGSVGLAVQSATGLVAAYLYEQLAEATPADAALPVPAWLRRFTSEPPAFLQYLLPDSVDPTLGPGSTPTGGAGRRTTYGSAFAPQGRSFGDARSGGSVTPAGGRTLNSASSSAIAGARSWFGRAQGAVTGVGGTQAAPSREEVLAAAERRLRARANNSIIGQHRTSAAASLSADTMRTTRSNVPAGQDSTSSALPASNHTSEAIRRTAASTASSRSSVNAKSITFGQLAAREERQRAESGAADEEDASGSGGRVAEQRRTGSRANSNHDGDSSPARTDESPRYSWGQGRRLGE